MAIVKNVRTSSNNRDIEQYETSSAQATTYIESIGLKLIIMHAIELLVCYCIDPFAMSSEKMVQHSKNWCFQNEFKINFTTSIQLQFEIRRERSHLTSALFITADDSLCEWRKHHFTDVTIYKYCFSFISASTKTAHNFFNGVWCPQPESAIKFENKKLSSYTDMDFILRPSFLTRLQPNLTRIFYTKSNFFANSRTVE